MQQENKDTELSRPYLCSHDIIMVFCWLSANEMVGLDFGESKEKLQVGKTQK